MYGSNWEKRVLGYQNHDNRTNIRTDTEQSKLTSGLKRVWLDQFDSWTPFQIWAQIEGLAESGGFLEID